MGKERRIRDPVHGLIVFRDDDLDQIAWQLLDAPEFQRLRRIKQLGFSEFIFPGATHTRFSHSVGVFHTARQLFEIIKRLTGSGFNEDRARTAVLAALLHDIGHGSFSHVFEEVQRSRNVRIKHEVWSSWIIRNPEGRIAKILGRDLSRQVGDLVQADSPSDIYHAIVSSSFDADRLDYLRRDRYMTGIGAGAIDFDWLLNNLAIGKLGLPPDDSEQPDPRIDVLCLTDKAVQPAEAFLLARFHLFLQVYLHKTTRGCERLLVHLLKRVSTLVRNYDEARTGLSDSRPLLRLFKAADASVPDYLALDDLVVWSSINDMRNATDSIISDLAGRLWERRLYKCVDVSGLLEGKESQSQTKKIADDIEREIKEKGGSPLRDFTQISVYGIREADDVPDHKRLMILSASGRPVEIVRKSKAIEAIGERRIDRIYLEDGDEVEKYRERLRGAP